MGNSGSGKSSLLRAGLIPALRRGRFDSGQGYLDSWRIAVFRPSASPFDELAEMLPGQLNPDLTATERKAFIEDCKQTLPAGGEALRNALAAIASPTHQNNRDTHVLLVVDQFEEIFTLTGDHYVRDGYITTLLNAAKPYGGMRVHLVLAIRADFYSGCLDHPELSRRLEENLYNVAVINPQQLRQGIENRLALAGASAEPGLLDAILDDVGTEPGNLALLEHALGQLSERDGGAGRTLTNDAYSKIGRLRGALGQHADAVHQRITTPSQQRLTQRIFLELVQLGEGAQDTRRRVPKEELLHLGTRSEVDQLLAFLATNRLIATEGGGTESPGKSFVEISHEALIREWPRLRAWLTENRDELRLQRRLLEAAEEWEGLNKHPSALLQGVRQAQAGEWLEKHPDVPVLLKEFLEASRRARDEATRKEHEDQKRELARQRELKQAAEARAEAERQLRKEAERRATLEKIATVLAQHSAVRTRRLSYALGSMLLILVAVAWRAVQQQRIAESRALAAEAEQMLSRDQGSALALAFRGWQTARTNEAKVAIAHTIPKVLATFQGHTGPVSEAVFSPDGQRIVTASSDDLAQVWSASNGEVLAALQGHSGAVYSAVFSPDGRRIVTASEDRTARVWNATTGEVLAVLEGHTGVVYCAVFSPDGRRIVTASADRTAQVWSASNGQVLATLQGHMGSVLEAVFSPDSRRIVTASSDDTAQVWSAISGQALAALQGHSGAVYSAVFSPDGRRIVTASADRTARVWNANTGQVLATLQGHKGAVYRAVFSPDSQRIITASADRTARVWNANTGQVLATLRGHTGAVQRAVFSPNGQLIVTASEDNTARVWRTVNLDDIAKILSP